MNFVDYCIATKNYSALSAVNEYSKSFSTNNARIKAFKSDPRDLTENEAEALNAGFNMALRGNLKNIELDDKFMDEYKGERYPRYAAVASSQADQKSSKAYRNYYLNKMANAFKSGDKNEFLGIRRGLRSLYDKQRDDDGKTLQDYLMERAKSK